jgi:acetyl-CoA acetyltransferase
VERDAIDYQVSASADYLDGRPFGFVAALDVMGSWPPRQDLHLEMDGSFATYYAWVKIQTGEVDTAIVCGHGKTSEGEPERVLNLQLDPYYQAPLGLTPTATAALQASAYQARTGASDADFAGIAARNRAAGARNPDNQVRDAATAAELSTTPWVVEPLRRGYLAPVGESAACLVLAAEGKAEALCDRPAEKAVAMAGLGSARDVDLVELLATTPAEELILCEALGLDARADTPAINPSGGALCGNPVMSTGLVRLGEVFRQLSGRAGERGVPGARRAIAHAAQGHCLQQNVVWVLGADRRWT